MSDLRDGGQFEMAHGFDDPPKVEDDLFRIAARDADNAHARLRAVTAQRDELLAALKGVVRVADRKTDEFDAARAAIARAEGK